MICAWIVTSSAVVGSSAIEELRIARQRHRDHHALTHAAGELVRIVVEPLDRIGDRDELQHLPGLLPRFFLRDLAMDANRLGDLRADLE